MFLLRALSPRAGPDAMNQTDLWTVGTIIGLTLVTIVTRSFFFFSAKPWSLPAWVQRGMDYAPIAALSASGPGLVAIGPALPTIPSASERH